MFASAKGKQQSRFDRYSRQKQCIDHIPYYLSGLSRAHFSDNLSRNRCIKQSLQRNLIFWFSFLVETNFPSYRLDMKSSQIKVHVNFMIRTKNTDVVGIRPSNSS